MNKNIINNIIYFIKQFRPYLITNVNIINKNNLEIKFKTKNKTNIQINNLNLITNIKVLNYDNFIIYGKDNYKLNFEKNNSNYTLTKFINESNEKQKIYPLQYHNYQEPSTQQKDYPLQYHKYQEPSTQQKDYPLQYHKYQEQSTRQKNYPLQYHNYQEPSTQQKDYPLTYTKHSKSTEPFLSSKFLNKKCKSLSNARCINTDFYSDSKDINMIWKHNSFDFCENNNKNCNLKKNYSYNKSKKKNFNNQIKEMNDIFSKSPLNIENSIIDKNCSSLSYNDCLNFKFDLNNKIYNSSDLCEIKDSKCRKKNLESDHIYSYSNKNDKYLYKYYKYKEKINQL